MSITEDELKERAVAPRVTLEQVNASIVSEHYFTADDGAFGAASFLVSEDEALANVHYEGHKSLKLLTFCVLVLKNGFTVTGQSACADPANYQADIGQKIAKQDAINKIWPLLGYELRTKLALVEQGTAPSHRDLKTYIGTKVIHAVQVTKLDYCTLRGWVVPADEDENEVGYLVEYADGGKPNVAGYTGYVSWSPKDVFEKAYAAVGSVPSVPAKAETWLDRLKQEVIELADKIEKLHAFLESEKVKDIPSIEWSALLEQRKVMLRYAEILEGRIRRATV